MIGHGLRKAIARVVAAARRMKAQRKEAVGRIKAIALFGERAIDPQRWAAALKDAVQCHEKTGLVPSLFSIMGLYGSERHHNHALAWLLSPDADHGVGRAVLLAIARELECKVLEEDLDDPRSTITVRGEMRWPDGAESSREPDLLIRYRQEGSVRRALPGLLAIGAGLIAAGGIAAFGVGPLRRVEPPFWPAFLAVGFLAAVLGTIAYFYGTRFLWGSITAGVIDLALLTAYAALQGRP